MRTPLWRTVPGPEPSLLAQAFSAKPRIRNIALGLLFLVLVAILFPFQVAMADSGQYTPPPPKPQVAPHPPPPGHRPPDGRRHENERPFPGGPGQYGPQYYPILVTPANVQPAQVTPAQVTPAEVTPAEVTPNNPTRTPIGPPGPNTPPAQPAPLPPYFYPAGAAAGANAAEAGENTDNPPPPPRAPAPPPPYSYPSPGNTAETPPAAPTSPALPAPNLPPLPGMTPAGAPAAPAAPAVPAKPLPVVTISSQVDTPNVPREETVVLTITLSWEQPASAPEEPLDFEFPTPPAAAGLTLFGNKVKAVTELSGNTVTVTRTYTYEFRADQEGVTEIKPVTVRYFRLGETEKKSLATLPLPVTVTKPALHAGKLLRHPAVLGGLAALIVLAGVALAWPRLKSSRAPKAAAIPQRSPHDFLREKLRETDRLRLAGDHGGFLLSLSHEVNRYLQDGIKIPTRDLAADKIGEAVAGKFGEEWRNRMTEFYKLGDKVKFAGHVPTTAEMDQAMDTAKSLIAEGEKLNAPAPAAPMAEAPKSEGTKSGPG